MIVALNHKKLQENSVGVGSRLEKFRDKLYFMLLAYFELMCVVCRNHGNFPIFPK